MTAGKYYRHKNSGAIALATSGTTATVVNTGNSDFELGANIGEVSAVIWDEVAPVLGEGADGGEAVEDDEDPGNDNLEF